MTLKLTLEDEVDYGVDRERLQEFVNNRESEGK